MPHVLCGVGVSVLAAARPRPPITAPLAAAVGRVRAAAIFRPGLRGRRATAAGPGGRNFRFLVGPVTVRTRVSAHASPCARKSCWVGKPGVPTTGLGANPHRRANGVGWGGPFRPRVN